MGVHWAMSIKRTSIWKIILVGEDLPPIICRPSTDWQWSKTWKYVCHGKFNTKHLTQFKSTTLRNCTTHNGNQSKVKLWLWIQGCKCQNSEENNTSQASTLRTHLETHSGGKQNKCNQCDYAFSQAGNLWRHLLSHIGEKSNKLNP